jgi:magnesium-transporting ATPase (P-type)
LQETSFLRFPFSSERKRISTGIIVNEKMYLILSGGAEIVV